MSYCGGLMVGGAVHDQRDLLTFRAVSETLLPNTSRLELLGPIITQSLRAFDSLPVPAELLALDLRGSFLNTILSNF